MVLILAETMYQLLNAINIKQSVLTDDEVDIVITSSTDFTGFIDRVRELNIFANVYHSEYDLTVNTELVKLAQKGNKRDIAKNPQKYLLDEEWMHKQYDKFFVVDLIHAYIHLVYYNFYAQFGAVPEVILYEDGTDTYTRNTTKAAHNACYSIVDLSVFPKEVWFERSYSTIMVYKPEICQNVSKRQLMAIPPVTDEIYEKLAHVFGEEALPKEKVIFFSEPFLDEFIHNNEVPLLEKIAERVGKENILIKLHPRCTYDRFTPLGFKVMTNSIIPFEIVAHDKEVENKILISVSSTAVNSPRLVYNYDVKTVMLRNMITVNRNFSTKKEFSDLMNLWNKKFNEEKRAIFYPHNLEELNCAIDYFEMRLGIDNE